MKNLKLFIFLLIIIGIIPIESANAWPTPIIFTIKMNINNQTSEKFFWTAEEIPLKGENPITPISSAQLQGLTTNYTPQGKILIFSANNPGINCLVQNGIFMSSFKIIKNSQSNSDFTCTLNDNTLTITSIGIEK